MQEEKEQDLQPSEQITNSKAADSGGKIIFENAVLCSQLLNGYVDMEELKHVKPEDIEDVTERFIPMFTEQRDADVIKKVHLSGDKDIFIALIEHKSGVDYNVGMQILRYMVYIWEDYEKEQNKLISGVSHTKDFKYPPILPIVYYEGKEKWTASRVLADRIVLNDLFSDYIPDFKYHLINLNEHDNRSLIERNDELSFVMLINKIKSDDDFKALKFPEGYLEMLFKKSPDDVLKTISRVISVVLRKKNLPENDIQNLIDKIEGRQHMGLFDDFEGFDVQEERCNGKKIKLIEQVCKKMAKGKLPEQIAEDLEEEVSSIQEIYDIANNFSPDYDAEKIYSALSDSKSLVNN